eukprot:3091022-Prymnesium_polylepis.1
MTSRLVTSFAPKQLAGLPNVEYAVGSLPHTQGCSGEGAGGGEGACCQCDGEGGRGGEKSP